MSLVYVQLPSYQRRQRAYEADFHSFKLRPSVPLFSSSSPNPPPFPWLSALLPLVTCRSSSPSEPLSSAIAPPSSEQRSPFLLSRGTSASFLRPTSSVSSVRSSSPYSEETKEQRAWDSGRRRRREADVGLADFGKLTSSSCRRRGGRVLRRHRRIPPHGEHRSQVVPPRHLHPLQCRLHPPNRRFSRHRTHLRWPRHRRLRRRTRDVRLPGLPRRVVAACDSWSSRWFLCVIPFFVFSSFFPPCSSSS